MNGCPLGWGGSGWETACCGQLCSTTKCNQCGYTSRSDEKSAILSLGIPKSSRGPNTSVIDCLRKFFIEEDIAGKDGWKCGKCGNGEGMRQVKMTDQPSLLIVHLKRFKVERGRLRKCVDPISIPLKLKIEKATFNLVGLVHHHGQTLAGGHYTAEVRETSGWWRYDDRSVSRTTRERDRESADAYLLFYVDGTEAGIHKW